MDFVKPEKQPYSCLAGGLSFYNGLSGCKEPLHRSVFVCLREDKIDGVWSNLLIVPHQSTNTYFWARFNSVFLLINCIRIKANSCNASISFLHPISGIFQNQTIVFDDPSLVILFYNLRQQNARTYLLDFVDKSYLLNDDLKIFWNVSACGSKMKTKKQTCHYSGECKALSVFHTLLDFVILISCVGGLLRYMQARPLFNGLTQYREDLVFKDFGHQWLFVVT